MTASGNPLTWRVMVPSSSELGERPVWDPHTQTLVWVNCLAGLIHRTSEATDNPGCWADSTSRVGDVIGAAAVRRDGGLIAGVDSAIRILDSRGRDTHDPLPVDLPAGHRFNDGACDPSGRFLIGTAGVGPDGVLWSIDGEGGIRVQLTGLTESNGLGWSIDGRTLYYIDSAEPVVQRHEYDLDSGTVGRRLTDLVDLSTRPGAPDGLAMDADGCAWVPQWQGGELARIDPSGEVISRWTLPVSQPTCAGFAGRDLHQLVLATSWESMSEGQREAEPWAGHLLLADGAVLGSRAHEFAG